ncbi:MAG TPA: AAA family ATPase [Syntrophales bacterium]|nr:AAA family ATPase [Syntrophales bacterium]
MDYGQYYGFSRMPFGEAADREVFFSAQTHQEAMAVTLYGIRERKGYIIISGEQGLGKSTLIRQVMNQLGEQTQAVLISKTHGQYYTLLKELMEKLGVGAAHEVTKGSMLHDLYDYLIQCLSKNRNVVIFLDDAHKMKDDIIEEMRLLSNLETSRTKLIQIVMVGEPELSRRLNSKHLRQIRQRIQILHRLLPLGRDEVLQYIEQRIAWAGRRSGQVFTPGALESICRYAGGIPQNVNTLCDRALTLGAERSERPVSGGTVGEAHRAAAPMIQTVPAPPAVAQAAKAVLLSPWAYAALVVVAAAVFLGSYYLGSRSGPAPERAVTQRAVSQKIYQPDHVAGTQSAKEAQSPGISAEKADIRPAPAARETGSVTQQSADAIASPKEVTVKEGDTLSSIATRYCGIVNATILDSILDSNPEITDVDLIRAGSQILLPQPPGKAMLLTRPDGTFGIHVATFMTYREAQDYGGKIGSDLGRVEIVKKRVAPQRDWYRILVGPFSSREDARRALQSLERLPTPP